jgi:hypothetical protein
MDCRRQEESTLYQPFYPGERVGLDSRCFNAMYSTATTTNESSTVRRRRRRPACLQVTCDPVRGVLVHHQASTFANGRDDEMMMVCQFSGQVIAFPPGSTATNNAVLVCPRLAVLCPELYTCPDACWGRGECVYPDEQNATTTTTTTTSGAVQRPYCRCLDATNRDPACAPSQSTVKTTTAATLARVVPRAPTSSSILTWDGEQFGGWMMAPIWFTLLLFIVGTVRQLQRRGMVRRQS